MDLQIGGAWKIKVLLPVEGGMIPETLFATLGGYPVDGQKLAGMLAGLFQA